MGRGSCPGRVWPCQRHFRDVFKGFAYRIWFGSLFPRRWLHMRCAKRMLLRSMCDPPLDTGIISSASALIGSSLHPRQFGFEQLGLWAPLVNLSFLSTGSPHSQQCVSSRMTRARILSRVWPCMRLGFVMPPPGVFVLPALVVRFQRGRRCDCRQPAITLAPSLGCVSSVGQGVPRVVED